MGIGSNLKKLRSNKSLSQKDLAEMLCVSPQAVSRWENDEVEPDISTLTKLSNIYGVTVDELINGGNDKIVESETIEEPEPVVEDHTEIVPVDESEFKTIKKDAERAARVKPLVNWGLKQMIFAIIGFIVIFVIAMIVNIKNNQLAVWPSIGWSCLWAYGAFSMIYCMATGSYILDTFCNIAGTTIKFPGIIFSWSWDGFKFLIAMKILFAVLGFLLGVAFTIAAIFIAAFLSMVSFPFILIHNIRKGADF